MINGKTLFLSLSVLASSALAENNQIKELANPQLPDIASVHFPPGQSPVILYNPILCRQAGPALCEFYRYHEYGHIAMNHNDRDDLTLQEKEDEADRWAALNAPLLSVITAYHFFANGHGGTPAHGKSSSRAERMIARTELLRHTSVTTH